MPYADVRGSVNLNLILAKLNSSWTCMCSGVLPCLFSADDTFFGPFSQGQVICDHSQLADMLSYFAVKCLSLICRVFSGLWIPMSLPLRQHNRSHGVHFLLSGTVMVEVHHAMTELEVDDLIINLHAL